MRTIRRREEKHSARRRQRDVLCDVMLSARECETWLTLDELAKLTHYPPASISAQLRHLRKPQNGAHAVIKRSIMYTRKTPRIWLAAQAPARITLRPKSDFNLLSSIERAKRSGPSKSFEDRMFLTNWNRVEMLQIVAKTSPAK